MAFVRALSLLLLTSSLFALAAPPTFRTDATPADDKTTLWHQIHPGEFPPPGSAHAIAGELVGVDHINRTGTLRVDRDDTQRRSEWDRTLPFEMLPYGSVGFRGAPAEVRDLPIGTHLHGQFYMSKVDKSLKAPFDRAIRLEDDFSHMTRRGRLWRVDAVALDKNALTVTGVNAADGKDADARPTTFVVNAATRVWKGRGIGELKDVAAGQTILMNLTACTLKGPGRATDLWLDADARAAATAHQLEVHRQFQREHGLPGFVTACDNEKGLVTVALFDGFDPKLRESFKANGQVGAAVAEENLRTYDQINDTMRGPVTAYSEMPNPPPGDSGVRLTFKPSFLIEGYRPKRVVRVFGNGWKVDDLPREERLYQ